MVVRFGRGDERVVDCQFDWQTFWSEGFDHRCGDHPQSPVRSDGHAEADVEPDVQRPNRISGGRRDKAAPMEKESEHVTAKHAQPASCHGAGGTSAGDDSPMKSCSFGRPSPVFAKRFAASRKAITLAVAVIEFA